MCVQRVCSGCMFRVCVQSVCSEGVFRGCVQRVCSGCMFRVCSGCMFRVYVQSGGRYREHSDFEADHHSILSPFLECFRVSTRLLRQGSLSQSY